MKEKLVPIAVACAFILASGLLVLVVVAQDEENDIKPAGVLVLEETGSNGLVEGGGSEVAARAASRQYVKAEISTADLSKQDLRLIALSAEEAAWLDRHFYPTKSELDRVGSNKLDDFRSAAALRDPKKLTLYGLELKSKGDLSAASAVLGKAADMGALYAREEAALVSYELAKSRFGNSADVQSIMVAGLEAARMLGDHRAIALAESLAPNFDYAARGAAVRAQAEEFIRQSNDSARLLGVPSLRPDPRPNHEIWRAIDANEKIDSEVVIYYR